MLAAATLRVVARRGIVLLLGLGLVLGVGCGGDDENLPAGATKSPVSGEPRFAGEDASLSALIVSPAGAAAPFRASNGRVLVSYELRLLNVTPFTLTVGAVSISTPDGEVVRRLDRRQARSALALPSARSGVRALGEGQQATLYLTVDFENRSAVPDRLVHRIVVQAPQLPRGRAVSAPVGVRLLKDFAVPVLGPPLQPGRGYIAADSCCSSSRHRRALLAVNGRQWLAQRFAVDWEQVDSTGRFVRRGGNGARNADYAIYGRRVIAAADAKIVRVVDGLPAQRPGALPQGIGPQETDGNSVVARLAGGLYMFYGHLQARSLKVKEGDAVRRGDPLGLVGNSGNTSAPHLHFHVMDGPSPLTSEGVPYAIDAFTTRGRLRSTAEFDRYENTTRPFHIVPFEGDGENSEQLPLHLTVVDFG